MLWKGRTVLRRARCGVRAPKETSLLELVVTLRQLTLGIAVESVCPQLTILMQHVASGRLQLVQVSRATRPDSRPLWGND